MFSALGTLAGQSLKHLPIALTTLAQWSTRHPASTVATFESGHARDYERNPYASYFSDDELLFPVRGADGAIFRNKEPIVGIRVGDATRAYPVSSIVSAPEGRITDTLGGGEIVLEARSEAEHVAVVSMPEGAQAVHTFWFAWKAFHPDTTLFDSEAP